MGSCSRRTHTTAHTHAHTRPRTPTVTHAPQVERLESEIKEARAATDKVQKEYNALSEKASDGWRATALLLWGTVGGPLDQAALL